MDFGEYRRFLVTNWPWIAGTAAVGVIVSMAIALLTPPTFTATSELFLATPGYSAVGSYTTNDTSPYQADGFSQQRARTYVKLATRTDLARRVIDQLGINMRPADLANSISASVRPDTVLIDVAVKSTSPADAKVLADAVVAELASDIRKLETLAGMRISSVDPVITQPADTPRTPSEPKVWLLLLLGSSVGLVVGISAAALRANQAVVIGAGSVIDLSGRPILGLANTRWFDSAEWQAIARNIAIHVEGRSCPVLCVVNVEPDAMAPTPATALARSFADAGRRVVLISLVSDGVGSSSNNDRPGGLAAVVAGHVDLADAVRLADGGSYHRMIGSGSDEMKPLLESQRFGAVLDQLRASFDLVVFEDAESRNLTTAAATLFEAADGVVLVVTDRRTACRALAAVVRQMRRHRVPLLGSVLRSDHPYAGPPNGGRQMAYQGGLPDENI